MNANCTIHVSTLRDPFAVVQPPPINTTRQIASLFSTLAPKVARGEQQLHLNVETLQGGYPNCIDTKNNGRSL